ncbi:hypothetical protein ACFQY5_32025 [Paeniroseomonas aquatica]|uniref:hypothetical protein n=1 Tax=Paeniroseomonas aquatica TaxID=373043 RepID=UPI00361FE8E2
MNLHRMLQRRAAEGRPVTVGVIGAGKFGSMFLAMAARTPGIQVAGIADLSVPRARRRWPASAGQRSNMPPPRSMRPWPAAPPT